MQSTVNILNILKCSTSVSLQGKEVTILLTQEKKKQENQVKDYYVKIQIIFRPKRLSDEVVTEKKKLEKN